MKNKILIVAVTLVPLSGMAQESTKQAQSQKEPQTKLEQFQAKTGTVIIMGFSTIGTIPAQFGTSVSVETREFTEASTNTKQYGISILVKESGRLERESKSYIDLDEIDSLLKGIDYIASVKKTSTSLSEFQADYRTRGDFSVSTFSTSRGDIGVAVKSGRFGSASAYLDFKDLPKLRQLIATALTTLQQIKTP